MFLHGRTCVMMIEEFIGYIFWLYGDIDTCHGPVPDGNNQLELKIQCKDLIGLFVLGEIFMYFPRALENVQILWADQNSREVPVLFYSEKWVKARKL